MSKPNIQELIAIAVKVAAFIAEKVKSGQWSGRFRKNTREQLAAQSEALDTLAEAVQTGAEIQAQLYLHIRDLENRLSEVESR